MVITEKPVHQVLFLIFGIAVAQSIFDMSRLQGLILFDAGVLGVWLTIHYAQKEKCLSVVTVDGTQKLSTSERDYNKSVLKL
jgi:positive regulator of sigma E activity